MNMTRTKWLFSILTAGACLCGPLGCQTLSKTDAPASQPRIVELPPVPDRLRAFYQDIKAGKFEILADFEQPAQTEIFRVEGPGSAHLTALRSRTSTGAGALEVRLDSPDAVLIVDDQSAKNWALSRDWTRYQLLIASIYAPAPIIANLQIRSGTDEPAWWVSDPKPLQPGWNLVRIDLAEVSRRVSLTDIRQMRLTVKAGTWPTTIHVDDILLADNTTVVFGNTSGEPGSLYVLKKGHRYHVGSVGRFELVFNRGVLSSWYDLSTDPDRMIDLTAGGPAGPVLTALDETGAPLGAIGAESWMGLGSGVQTHLQVIETNTLAVTIKGAIRYAAGPDGMDDPVPATGQNAPQTRTSTSQPAGSQATARPKPAGTQAAPVEQTYVYTIRQDGRVFVDISATVAHGTFHPAKVGLAVTNLSALFQLKQVDPLDSDLLRPSTSDPASTPQASAEGVAGRPQASADGVAGKPQASAGVSVADPSPEEGAQRPPIPRALLLAGVRSSGANLLLVPGNPALFERVVSATRQTGDIAAHMYVMDKPTSGRIHMTAMLAVWPADLKDLPTAAAIARDYQQPDPPKVEVGRLHTDADGDLDGDGFAEATGKWMVEPDGQILRLRWPAGQLRFWPMIQVMGLGGKACWAYLDGRIIKPIERRPNGDMEFVIPGILSRPALLEVTVEK